MKKVVLPILLILIPIVGFSQKLSNQELNEVLKYASEEINKNTPLVVDEYTTLVNSLGLVIGGNGMIVYNYQIDESIFDEYDVSKSDFELYKQIELKNFYCSDPDFQLFRDNDVSGTWKYTNLLGTHIAKITIYSSDCK